MLDKFIVNSIFKAALEKPKRKEVEVVNKKKDALIVLAKYPRPPHVKTRLIPALGETAASHISELFLVDLLRRLSATKRWKIFIAGAITDTVLEFDDLLARHRIPRQNIESFIPQGNSMEDDIVKAYKYVLRKHERAVLTCPRYSLS